MIVIVSGSPLTRDEVQTAKNKAVELLFAVGFGWGRKRLLLNL
jgi:hypothetical protein